MIATFKAMKEISKLPNVGTTIFTTMSKLANEYGAINLAQGFPDFNVDEKLVNTLKDVAGKDVHQYMPMGGNPSLLVQIARLINDRYGRVCVPEQNILVTAGATQAIFTALIALVQSGDEVIILDPSYDCYSPAVALAGGNAIHVDLNDDYSPNWDAIRKAFNENTRLLLVNNPHNPSGKVWSEEDLSHLCEILREFPNVILLSDEVYEFIHFEKKHLSAHLYADLHNRTIVVSSFGKSFHITGWKIGYLVAPEKLMVEIKKVHQFNVFSVNSVSQATLAAYLPLSDVGSLKETYMEKRDLFRSLLNSSKFKLLPSEGSYFQLADYSDISDLDDVSFCQYLTKEVGVAAIPVSVFNASGKDRKHIRFCYAKKDETLIQAAERLCKI